MPRRQGSRGIRIWVLALTVVVLVIGALVLWPVRDYNCAYPNTAAIIMCTQSIAGIVMRNQAAIATLVLTDALVVGLVLAVIPTRRQRRR